MSTEEKVMTSLKYLKQNMEKEDYKLLKKIVKKYGVLAYVINAYMYECSTWFGRYIVENSEEIPKAYKPFINCRDLGLAELEGSYLDLTFEQFCEDMNCEEEFKHYFEKLNDITFVFCNDS